MSRTMIPKNVFKNMVASNLLETDLLNEVSLSTYISPKGNEFIVIGEKVDITGGEAQDRITMRGESYRQLVNMGLVTRDDIEAKGYKLDKFQGNFKSEDGSSVSMISLSKASSNWDDIMTELEKEAEGPTLTDDNSLVF